jgi:TonB-dependent receptor
MYLKSCFFLLLTFFLAHIVYSQTVSIKGKIIDHRTGEILGGCYISCLNTSFKTFSDNEGFFVLKNIPEGTYEVVIESVGFNQVSRHLIVNGKTSVIQLNIELEEKSLTLQKVNVYTQINQEEEVGSRYKEKKALNIINAISSKAMEVSPDINAANVLQRMSGLTIQRNGGGDEAYAIIRGLDPRYNNTLINGIKIASPDEKNRFVPLSIVPSDLLASIEVSKSLLPEMEGDAIGGTVNLMMKDAPQGFLLKAIASIGYSAIFFDRKYTGFSKSDIQKYSPVERFGSSYRAQPGDFSRSNMDFTQSKPPPTVVAGITYGQRFFKNKLGILVADNYQNQYYGSNSVFNTAAPNSKGPIVSDYANRYFSTQQLNNGLVIHADYNFNEQNKIVLTNVFLYSYLAQSRTIIDTALIGGNGGRTVPGTGPISTDYTSLTNQQIIENLKIEGHHILSPHFLFDWAGVYSEAGKRTPDWADISVNKKIDTVHTNGDIHGPYTFSTTPDYFDQISRIWQNNNDQDLDAIANLSYKNKFSNSLFLQLKMGGLYRHKTRFNQQDEYTLKPTTGSNGVKQIFTDINTAQWVVYSPAGTYDYDVNNYNLFENITAGYGQFQIEDKKWEVAGGARVEITSQGYTLRTFYAGHPTGLTKDYTDLLPSLMIKYRLNEKTNLRASYYKSISRPNYYELVPAQILSLSSASSTTGNPDLEHSVANNYDIRYEFYPKGEDQLFLGAFYKNIENAIEYSYQDATVLMPVNSGNATVYGAELVLTKYIGNFGITGNYTYLYSRIFSNKAYTDYRYNPPRPVPDTLQERPLQGETNNTVNLSLIYKNSKKGFFAEIAYQYLGKTLSVVYPLLGYDYYQNPYSMLAFSAEKILANKHFTVFTKWNNLLNTAITYSINNLQTQQVETKLNFSFGLRYVY